MTALKFELLRDFPVANAVALREALQRFERNVEVFAGNVKDLFERPFTRQARPVTASGQSAAPGQVVRVSTESGNVELLLPRPETVPGREFLVLKMEAANTLTLRPVSGTINAAATLAITAAGATWIYCDGGAYYT